MCANIYHRTDHSNFPIYLHSENIPPSLDEAYSLIKKELTLWEEAPAAWKLGGTSHTTSRLYSVSAPYFGMLKASEVWSSPCSLRLKDKQHTSVELECILRLGQSFSSILHAGEETLISCPLELLFDLWAWGLEMPFSPIANLPELGLPALVADRCAAGSLVLGTPHKFLPNSPEEWKEARVQLAIDGKIQAEGKIEALTTPPDICVRRFLVEALRYDFMPMPGQWIASGGLTPCFSLALARKVEVLRASQNECTVYLPE